MAIFCGFIIYEKLKNYEKKNILNLFRVYIWTSDFSLVGF